MGCSLVASENQNDRQASIDREDIAMAARLSLAGLLTYLVTTSLACVGENQVTARNRLITLDPGHFHAALVQKTMYEQVSPAVHVYAPKGPDVENYLSMIKRFNARQEKPTSWQEKVYTGGDFLEKLLKEKPGNIVVISGKNKRKTEYIKACVDAGLNVLADKPMCVDSRGFELLEQAFESAGHNNVLLYDIMTERSSITSILQKELIGNEEVFGRLEKGSADKPAISSRSTHHFFKYVAGKPLRRPGWYFDTTQQGEGIVDVTTHLVDLIMWTCFPEQIINYKRDIRMKKARRWPTMISRSQYEKVTGLKDFPGFLKKKLNDKGLLACYANGEMTYTIKGTYVKLVSRWNYRAPEGAGDTYFSLIRGTRSNIIIRQGKRRNHLGELYVEPASDAEANQLANALKKAITTLQGKYPGLSVEKQGKRWHILIPAKLRTGHESHFAEVVRRYLKYIKDGKLPEWEIAFIKAKYYTTTAALERARVKKQVKLVQADDRIDVFAGHRLLTSYRYGDELDKPILLPINSPSGIMVTRGWPILNIEGESHDHPHHKGLWFAHRKVNNNDFWLDGASDAHIKHIKATKMAGGDNKGELATVLHWIDKTGRVVLEEKRDMVFTVAPDQYIIDFDITLTAVEKQVVFTDDKDGMFALQVADWLTESTGTGTYFNSSGYKTAENIWGKRANWVRLEGQKDYRTIGVAILNHPASFNSPTHWHTRDYGLFSANPIGMSVFEPEKHSGNTPLKLKLKAGKTLYFKFRVIIYEGPNSREQLDKQFGRFVKEPAAGTSTFNK